MPSQSGKQHRFFEAVAHDPKFAKKAGVAQSVGQEFVLADVGRKFAPPSQPKPQKKGKRK